MQDKQSTTESLEHLTLPPNSHFSGRRLGAWHALHRHFPHSIQMMLSTCLGSCGAEGAGGAWLTGGAAAAAAAAEALLSHELLED